MRQEREQERGLGNENGIILSFKEKSRKIAQLWPGIARLTGGLAEHSYARAQRWPRESNYFAPVSKALGLGSRNLKASAARPITLNEKQTPRASSICSREAPARGLTECRPL